ncbi:MAG TPA: hypothetical protein VGL97_11245 [Bryobacteraceae bacterium]|jgi:hypothetical protein
MSVLQFDQLAIEALLNPAGGRLEAGLSTYRNLLPAFKVMNSTSGN